MSAAVDHPNDDNGVGQNSVENRIWKAFDEHAPEISILDWVRERGIPNAFDRLIQRATEDGAKTAPLLLVPAEGLQSFSAGLGKKDDAAHDSPAVISARTSSQGTPTGPSCSRRSSRRSSSARSSALSSRSSGERLRQRSSIRSS